ncbi:SO_0444 family Cu/Zn efflux transporter [Agaribacterium haliotis]|uniref:SO_0444 family Cu/Zn efflux transporter n=1 Tax=Agaribacterium haliotis TaxID=2013869 RepID=UPI000BB569EC|nr:SO_0444 family Cu/Zn efflux transporter [Agaribacterium haliotis]
MNLIANFADIFVESAPWLLLGLLVAGLMKAFVPQQLLARHLGKPGFTSTLKAALFGAPLPLCSCGVIPAALGLRRSGASKASTTSFLISTPETGVDSISISYALLGPFMAIIRPIAAICSAICAGLLVGKDDDKTPTSATEQADKQASCCAKTTETTETTETKANETSTCCSKEKANTSTSVIEKIKQGLRFCFIDLVKDISPWLLIGLAFAAIVRTYVPTEFLSQWGDGLLAFIVMAAIGVPMYICATASTPIAAGFLFSGVSPGAVLVFMLVGPATNIATVGLVRRELGKRALAAYLGSVIGVGFVFGALTNYLAAQYDLNFLAQAQHAHAMLPSTLSYAAAIVLAAFMTRGLVSQFNARPAPTNN